VIGLERILSGDKMVTRKSWKDILKMTFDEAEEKANKIMMEKYNPEGMAGVSIDWATIHDGKSEEYNKLIQSFMGEKQ